MNKAIEVTILHELDEQLGAEWLGLLRSAAYSHPVMNPDFVQAVATMARPNSKPVILCARRQGRLIGLLALGTESSRIGPFRFTGIRTLSPGRHDLAVVIAEPDMEEVVSTEFAGILEQFRLEGLEINFNGVPTSSKLLGKLSTGFSTIGSTPIWQISLEGAQSWEDVILVGHQRVDIRRRARKLKKEHGYAIQWGNNPTEVRTMTRTFVSIHRRQQTEKGRSSAFGHDFIGDQLASYLAAAVPARKADIATLVLHSGAVIAAEILLYDDQRAYRYRTTFDSDWRRYGPGNILLAGSVDRAIYRGIGCLDLGWGTEPYKSNWGTPAGQVCRLLGKLPRGRAAGYRLLRRMGWHRTIVPNE